MDEAHSAFGAKGEYGCRSLGSVGSLRSLGSLGSLAGRGKKKGSSEKLYGAVQAGLLAFWSIKLGLLLWFLSAQAKRLHTFKFHVVIQCLRSVFQLTRFNLDSPKAES